jgi:hypothetical protein
MPDYSKGKIYTVRCRTDNNLIYIGSTTQSLSARFAKHKCDKNVSLYKYINEICNGNWSDWYIELFELCPCNSKMELEKREGEVQRQIATINKNIGGRTRSEWLNNNKEKIKEYSQEYYQENLEKIKEYYQENKEKIYEQTKIHYQKHKDEINEKKRSKIVCECGCEISKSILLKHLITKKHQHLIAALTPINT